MRTVGLEAHTVHKDNEALAREVAALTQRVTELISENEALKKQLDKAKKASKEAAKSDT